MISEPGTKGLVTQIAAALNQLAEALDRGESPQLQRFLTAMGRFHCYSPRNLLLILGQRSDATLVAGFHTWRKLGRSVRKGERGIRIMAPVNRRKHTDDDDDEEDDYVIRYRAVTVFDIAQTHGEPLPELSTTVGEPGEWMHAIESAIRRSGIVFETAEGLGGAEGVSTGGLVQVLASLSPARRFSVLAHEWAHELLHKVEPASRPNKTVRETEAEAVAFVVCSSIGLETGTASSDYIRLYNGDREALLGSLDRIQRAACTIIEGMREQAEDRQSPSRSIVRPSVHTGAASSVCTERTASSRDEKNDQQQTAMEDPGRRCASHRLEQRDQEPIGRADRTRERDDRPPLPRRGRAVEDLGLALAARPNRGVRGCPPRDRASCAGERTGEAA